ncbi:MAG TPA: trehalose-phosphatase [Gemmatimonadales bacterium]|nr:trehalose-phosphatase [Gemmatimonadales bacterium]
MSRNARRLPPPRQDWAYFFDIDGTLVDLADSPGGVRLDAGLRQMVERLYRASGGALALISGRSIADIDGLFPDLRLPAAGQHGTERRDAAGRVARHAVPTAQLERAHDQLARAVAGRPGLLLEHKGLSLALHYRRAPRLAGYAHRLARSLLPRTGTPYCIQTGKRIVEMKPAGRDKGMAVLEFMAEEPFRGRTAVFVGDDATDEYGFETVNRLHGYSIKVGAGRSTARWRLRDVQAVREWLERGLP